MRSILFNQNKTFLFVSFLCLFFKVSAQAPANDNCAGAVVLTSATSCNPTIGTFISATQHTSPTIAAPIFTYAANGNFTSLGSLAGLKIDCWGAGGGGGRGNVRGGGGGGGGFSSGIVNTTTSGGIHAINVGSGGAGATSNGVAPNGGFTNFINTAGTTVVLANGGTGGNSSGVTGAGATVGSGTGIITSVFRLGGNGGAADGTVSGGGGGGAGTTANGNAGALNTPGAAVAIGGGAGGAGRTTDGIGGTGSTRGGGGGGGRSGNGGSGANGFVQLTLGDINSLDVWYRFQAQSTNPKIALSNIGNDLLDKSPYFQLYSGVCGSLLLIATETDGLMNANSLTIGTFYYIRVATTASFAPPTAGLYTFNICVQDPLPPAPNSVDFSKGYINVTSGTVGGTINQGDILEIRATLVVAANPSNITNVSYYDTLKRGAGFIFRDSLSTRTNEGKNFNTFTPFATGDDQGWLAPVLPALIDTSIQINIGTGATPTAGGSITGTDKPNLFGFACIIMATYRVRVDTGLVGYGRKINYGGGAFRYKLSGVDRIISFPRDSLIVLPNLSACSDAVSPANLIGTANNGSFGTPASSSGTQNGGPAAINTTYNYETYTTGPNDYFYGITNNSSKTNTVNQTVSKGGAGSAPRVFSVWDISGDHTGATNTAKGNKPCNPTQPISASNPCGYMLTVNAAYRSDKVFEYTATGICTDTYYEVSAWFKNLCSRCGCDVNGIASGSPSYIPTSLGDSSGVRPNIAMQIDGVDYYTTGDILYQGFGGTQSASDTMNNWVRRSFVFKTGPSQTTFKVTFRNNAPGGGGNDWAIDDIGLRTCYPTMTYAPPNPIVYMGSSLTITDTVRSYFNSYTYYKWERKPVAGGWVDVVPASTGNATPVYKPLINQFEYVISYTIPGTATLAANAGDAYRMVVASNALNLANGCNFVPSTTFTLLPTDAPCAIADTNYAVTPESGKINWNDLKWSLGHIPTCCESVHITYNGINTGVDDITVDITNDICIRNLTLLNSATSATNKILRNNLFAGFRMVMNGNVRMGANGFLSSDSCLFYGNGNNTITVNGNTQVGYAGDRAYSIIGSAPGTAAEITYILRGDSLTFNGTGLTSDKFVTMVMNPILDTAYLVNNTTVSPYPNAVTFQNYRIGNGIKATTVITIGSNQNSFMNNGGGALDVTSNGILVLPANYTINARPAANSSLQLRANSTIRVGGYSGGTTGSNFPANFTAYNANSSSLTEYYGDNTNTQTVHGITYGRLELRNGSNGLGAGRAQKNSILPIASLTSINVNQQTDFTLGALGGSTQPVSCTGSFNLTAGSGLYCNANLVNGVGTFTMGNGSYLGIGHLQGISNLGNATGNIQLTGGRSYNSTGNYIYNGLVNQITGGGLPTTINELTIDNSLIVTNSQNVLANGIALLKQGTFDILGTRFTSNGTNGTLNSVSGKMKANLGIVEMKGTSGVAQNLSGNWFVNKTISSLINANNTGITVAPAPADTLLIASALVYGAVINSAIATNNNLTLLSRDTATARFGTMVSGNSILGTVTIERFLPARKSWRLIAAPVANATAPSVTNSWRESGAPLTSTGYGTRITGPATFVGVDETTQRASMKFYNGVINNYVDVSNTNSNVANTAGYYVFVRGDRGVPISGAAGSTILRIKGDIITGTQTINVPAGKFVTFGNPYPSTLNLLTASKANISNTYYAWNPNSAGSYNVGAFENYTFDGTNYIKVPGGTIRNDIQSGEAIFIQSNGAAGTFAINETDKIGGVTTPVSRQSTTELRAGVTVPTLEINMYTKDVDGSSYLADGILMNFGEGYSSAVDNDDVRKISNVGDNLFLKNGIANLIVDRRPTLKVTDTIRLNLTNTRINPYRFEFDPSVLSNLGLEGTLKDKFLLNETPISLSAITNYNFEITSEVASRASDRFMIVFKQLPRMRFIKITALRNSDNTASVDWYTENENNINTYSIEHSKDGINFSELAKQTPTANNNGNPYYSFIHSTPVDGNNWYRVKANAISGNAQFSEIVKIGAKQMDIPASTAIYPNPVIEGKVHVNFVNETRGKYQLVISNMIGQTVYTEQFQLESNNLKKIIALDNAAAGNYQLIIKDEKGSTKKISFLIK